MEGNVRMRRIFSAQEDTRAILFERAKLLRAEASRMPPGVEQDRLLRQARQIETETRAEDWANSPGLQPPK
jgi:hypothetical protein